MHSPRRGFLVRSMAFLAGSAAARLSALDPPAVSDPRATSGDDVAEPDWAHRLAVTVGNKEADLVGGTHRVIQAAVDYVARLGGGTVEILPGRFELRNAVHLASGVRLKGSGTDSVLLKCPSVTTRLSRDSDWYDQEITLEDASGFEVGDGICLRTRNPHDGGTDVAKRTLVARDGRRFKLDRALRENFWLMGDSTVSLLFPILSGKEVENVAVESLLLDGNRQANDNLDGNYAGCIFLEDCRRMTIRKVTARAYNGDGISWQICHDVVVEQCTSHGHAGLGLHPGSGSQRPVIRDNEVVDNDIGLFFCWGVKYGLAERNRIRGNRVGISIGHRDTDNLIRDNDVAASREVGVLFRPERGPDFAPHRNRLERNRIHDSGDESGIAVDVQGQPKGVRIEGNSLVETRGPAQRIGIRLGAESRGTVLVDNRFQGFSHDVQDLSKS